MLNNSFKKIVSAACVLAMSISLTMPMASADYYNEDKSAIIINNQTMVDEEEILSASSTTVQSKTYTFDSAKSGNFSYSFDYTLLGRPVDNPDRSKNGANTSAYIQFKAGSSVASAFTFETMDANGNAQFALVNSNYTQLFKIKQGVSYNFKYAWTDAAMGANGTPTCHVTITNNETGETVLDEDVNQRNLTDTSNAGSSVAIDGMAFGYCADKRYGQAQPIVSISNMTVNDGAADRTVVNLDGKELVTTETAELVHDFSEDGFDMTAAPYQGDTDVSGTVSMVTALTNISNGASNYITYDAENKRLLISDGLPAGEYTFNIDTYIDGIRNQTHQVYPVHLTVEQADSKALAQKYLDGVTLKHTDGTAVSGNKIMGDLDLDKGEGVKVVTWKCYEAGENGEWVESDKISADGKVSFGAENADVKLVAECVYNQDTENAVQKEFEVTIANEKEYLDKSIESLVPLSNILDDNKEYTPLEMEDGKYLVFDNLHLPATINGVDVEWKFVKKDASGNEVENDETILISGETGIIAGEAEEGCTYELVASAKYGAATSEKTFALNLEGASSAYDVEKINEATVKVQNADNKEETFDLTSTDALKHDIILPTTVDGYSNVRITWTSSDEEHLKKADDNSNVWKIYTGDTDAHDVKLTKKIDYVVNGTTLYSKEYTYNVKVEFTADDVASEDTKYDKYKARFDSVCKENLESIPSRASENFELPTEGEFGSTISWQSKNVSAIKISGDEAKVTRLSSSQNVTLEAVFTYNNVTSDDKATVTVTVPAKSGSSGGSSSGSSGSSSGGGNSYKGSIVGSIGGTTPAAPATTAPIETPEGFTDIADVSWAVEAINALADKGFVSGRSETIFAPNDNVTRAEFAKMLYGAFDLANAAKGDKEASFTDVNASDWYYDFVMTCAQDGIITGYDNGAFGANDLVTRQDMAVMIMRAVEYTGKTVEEVNAAVTFDDAADIASYAADAVASLQKGGIINGMTETTFAPLANATRAQAAKMLYNFCK